jgi:hypothetical protein
MIAAVLPMRSLLYFLLISVSLSRSIAMPKSKFFALLPNFWNMRLIESQDYPKLHNGIESQESRGSIELLALPIDRVNYTTSIMKTEM